MVVPSHDRPLRLRWLLNALEEQDAPPGAFEVIVAHDSTGPATAELLDAHPLSRAGVARALAFSSRRSPAALRNAGWRAARAPVIAFTDDDCRPPRSWVRQAIEAARRHPGAVIQGATHPDPDEAALLTAPHARTQLIHPPVPYAQTCNIIYPRELLERLGGFDERMPYAAGEDTDLAIRARRSGAPYVGASEVLTYHAVEAGSLLKRLRSIWRWQALAYMIKRHPELRRHFPLWIFWKRTHAWLPLAAVAALLGRRRPLALPLALPWLVHTLPRYGTSPRGRLRSLIELPGRAAIDLTEFATLAWGSLKHRTLFL